MPETTSTALPSFSRDQHHETDAVKTERGRTVEKHEQSVVIYKVEFLYVRVSLLPINSSPLRSTLTYEMYSESVFVRIDCMFTSFSSTEFPIDNLLLLSYHTPLGRCCVHNAPPVVTNSCLPPCRCKVVLLAKVCLHCKKPDMWLGLPNGRFQSGDSARITAYSTVVVPMW